MTKVKEKDASLDLLEKLGKAFGDAIEVARPMQKKSILNRKKGGPWAAKDGEVKQKLRRTHFQHSIRLIEDQLSPEEVALLNKIKPGSYCDGNVKVILRKDRGIDIDYPVKTASQRLRLVNQFGIINFESMLERIVKEAAAPKKAEEVYED